jgi:hypothetical protein
MGGRSGKTRERDQPDIGRVIAGRKGAKTKAKKIKIAEARKARRRGQIKTLTVGLSRVAAGNLDAAMRKDGRSEGEVLDRLLLSEKKSVKFKKGRKTTFTISTEAFKKLEHAEAHYQVSREAVIERYLRDLS